MPNDRQELSHGAVGPRRRRRLLSTALIAVLGVALAACSSGSSTASAGTKSTSGSSTGSSSVSYPATFQFGAMEPLSGVDAAVGAQAQAALNIGVTKVNSSGVLGKTKLKVVYRDNPGTPKTAVTNIDELNSVNHVPFSFTTFSSATVAIAPSATQYKMVLMNPGATTTHFENLSPYLFSDIPLGDLQAKAMLTYAYDNLHLKSLAGVFAKTAQGTTFQTFITKFWKTTLGGTYVGTTTVTTTQTDFSTAVTQVANEHPQAVFVGFFGSGQGDLIKQAAAQGLKPTWLGSTSWANTAAIQAAGPYATGVYSSQVELNKTNATTASFSSAYQKAVGSPVSSFAELAYSGFQILVTCLKHLKAENKAFTGPNIRSEILSLHFTTVNGPMTFKKTGSAEVPVALTVYKNGKFTTLAIFKTTKLSSAS